MATTDITLLGSGISCTVTLIEVFEQLLHATPGKEPVNITVVEKNKDWWKGIPYGARSSVNALTITSVQDFIYEAEQPHFFAWLKDNKKEWMPWYRTHGGITAARWLENNLPLIDKEAWDDVYIPRFIFGNYLKEKLTTLLKEVEAKGLATVRLIQAEATSVTRTENELYEVKLEYTDGITATILTPKLVIATGSAPVKKLYDGKNGGATCINDIYEPSVRDNTKTIQAALSQTEDAADRNVLIIGSNASSIELLYLLEGLPQVRTLLNKTVVLSTSGALPHPISTTELKVHPVPHLDELRTTEHYTIEKLVTTAAEDIKLAVANGANVGYIATVIRNTLELMEPLGEDAKKAFFAIHGVWLRDQFRRSGPEYKSGSQTLLEQQEVILLKGKFLHATTSANGSLVSYLDATTGEEETYPLNFKAIINCSGSTMLDQCASPLLHDLVSSGLCKMNLSGKGLEVNEQFEAAPNLYVMGPLLGGNMNKLIHFWHLENASRLMYLAPYLAKELLGNIPPKGKIARPRKLKTI